MEVIALCRVRPASARDTPQAVSLAPKIPRRLFTASRSFCLHPIVPFRCCTEAWPIRNLISPVFASTPWHRRAQVRRRLLGCRFATYKTTLAVRPADCSILPSVTPEWRSHGSTSSLRYDGTGNAPTGSWRPFANPSSSGEIYTPTPLAYQHGH